MSPAADPVALVRQLVAGGESLTVEFKGESRAPLSDTDLVEAAVCLANGRGGHLIVGVEDDGHVSGARKRHGGSTDARKVQALVANRTQPALTTEVALVPLDEHEVLLIAVPQSEAPVGTARGTYVRRALGGDGRPTCIPYHAHEMLSREIDRGRTDFAALPVAGARCSDLDPLEFERLRRLVREAGARSDAVLSELSDVEVARALGVARGDVDEPELLTGALLLFGREPALRSFVPTHEVAFQVLADLQLETNEFFRGPLLRTAEELLARFRSRNREEELQFGLVRVAVPAWSETAFREAVANALTHRDYTVPAAVHVQWTDDALEISSPGGFPPGVRVDNLLTAAPRPRSPLLADAFKRAGLVERSGRGVNRMFAEQLRVGRPAPDYGRSTDDAVVAVIPGGPADLNVTRWVLEQEQQGAPLSLGELQVVGELLQERRVTTGQMATVLQRTETETRATLQRLVERGVIEARGEGRARTWHLSAAAYRQMSEPSAYVRIRGFEPLQQEQMVLAYVAAHGRITRGQAAQLCAVSPEQAGALLKRLSDRRLLLRQGERRGTFYILPEAGGRP